MAGGSIDQSTGRLAYHSRLEDDDDDDDELL